MLQRLSWGIADQGVSSLTNFMLGIVVARSLGAESFGAFTLAYVTYGVVINASRGLATDPLVVRHSGRPDAEMRAPVAAATATAVLVGIGCGILSIGVGAVAPGQVGLAFLALGIGLPGLMLQDAWRFVFFASGRPHRALVNDLVWGVLLLGVLVGLHRAGQLDVMTAVLAFGGTAAVAALLGFAQTGVRPQFGDVRWWVLKHRDLGSRYLVENLSIGGASQLRMVALGWVAGLAAVGDVRAAEILMGPFLVILMGLSQVAVPEAARVVARAPHRLPLFCFGLGGVQAVAAAAWGALVLLLLPHGLGDLLLGDIWESAAALLPIIVVGLVMGALEVGATTGVRALGAARRSLFAQLTGSGLYLVGGTVGAVVDGARGSCWGVAIGITVAAVVWWVQLRRAVNEHPLAVPPLGTEDDLVPERIST